MALTVHSCILVHSGVNCARDERAQVLQAALERVTPALLSDPVHTSTLTHRLGQAHRVPVADVNTVKVQAEQFLGLLYGDESHFVIAT